MIFFPRKNIIQKSDIITNIILTTFIYLIIFSPKYNILSIPGVTKVFYLFRDEYESTQFWQGIRMEDLLLFVFFIYLLFNFNKLKININLPGTNFIFFFPIFLISSLFAASTFLSERLYQQGFVNILLIIRYIEYIVFFLLLINQLQNKKFILLLTQSFILINFLVTLGQEFNLYGSITSRGIMQAGSLLSQRPTGLMGGPWELGATLSLAFFTIYVLDKKNYFKIFFFLTLVLISLILAETRGNIIGFLAALVFLEKNIKIRIFLIILFIYALNNLGVLGFIIPYSIITVIAVSILLLLYNNWLYRFSIIMLFILLYLFFININYEFLTIISKLDISWLLKTFYNFVFYNYIPHTTDTPDLHYYYSIVLRLEFWQEPFMQMRSNIYSLFFGMGGEYLYYESFILRLYFTFGIIGCLIILYLSRKLPLFLIVFSLLGGLTFDLYYSSKTFYMAAVLIVALWLIKREENSLHKFR